MVRPAAAMCRRQINYIGKEANRWEEQFFLGMDEDAEIEYGADPNAAALFDELTLATSANNN
jgi:hypothetical protein